MYYRFEYLGRNDQYFQWRNALEIFTPSEKKTLRTLFEKSVTNKDNEEVQQWLTPQGYAKYGTAIKAILENKPNIRWRLKSENWPGHMVGNGQIRAWFAIDNYMTKYWMLLRAKTSPELQTELPISELTIDMDRTPIILRWGTLIHKFTETTRVNNQAAPMVPNDTLELEFFLPFFDEKIPTECSIISHRMNRKKSEHGCMHLTDLTLYSRKQSIYILDQKQEPYVIQW